MILIFSFPLIILSLKKGKEEKKGFTILFLLISTLFFFYDKKVMFVGGRGSSITRLWWHYDERIELWFLCSWIYWQYISYCLWSPKLDCDLRKLNKKYIPNNVFNVVIQCTKIHFASILIKNLLFKKCFKVLYFSS